MASVVHAGSYTLDSTGPCVGVLFSTDGKGEDVFVDLLSLPFVFLAHPHLPGWFSHLVQAFRTHFPMIFLVTKPGQFLRCSLAMVMLQVDGSGTWVGRTRHLVVIHRYQLIAPWFFLAAMTQRCPVVRRPGPFDHLPAVLAPPGLGNGGLFREHPWYDSSPQLHGCSDPRYPGTILHHGQDPVTRCWQSHQRPWSVQ